MEMRISDLPVAETVGGGDFLELAQGGASKALPVATLLAGTATAIQGAKANTAVQPGTSPSLRGVAIARPAGEAGYYSFATASGGGGPGNRWIVGVDGAAETGSNAGSNFWIARYADAGAWLDTPLFIYRSNGRIGIAHPPMLPSYTVATLPSAGVSALGVAFVSNGAGNRRLAVSDGAAWRWPDGTVVS